MQILGNSFPSAECEVVHKNNCVRLKCSRDWDQARCLAENNRTLLLFRIMAPLTTVNYEMCSVSNTPILEMGEGKSAFLFLGHKTRTVRKTSTFFQKESPLLFGDIFFVQRTYYVLNVC